MSAPHRLFTPGFFVMCGFSFTVFLSVFQLLPTAPFHIHDLGGSTFASGLFLGFLTYSSAFSAPLTGAVVDRIGQRRVLITSSVAITVFSILYGRISDYRWLLGAGRRPRNFLVGAAVRVGGVHDQHAAGGAAGRGHRVLGSVERAGTGGRANRRILDLPARLVVALCRVRHPEHRHGHHRFAAAGDSASGAPSSEPRARRARVARARHVGHAVPVLVRLRRNHQLHRPVCRRQSRQAESDLPHDACALSSS